MTHLAGLFMGLQEHSFLHSVPLDLQKVSS